MSYSYTNILNCILKAHAENSPVSALEHYATLSEHCSMTPLLWIQYALDSSTSSVDPSHTLAMEIMELALEEFPGCVILWMYYLDIAVHYHGDGTTATAMNPWDVWKKAIEAISGMQTCAPSHPNVLLELYRLGVLCFPEKAREIYIQRAECLVCGNESIQSEMCNTSSSSTSNNDSVVALLDEQVYEQVEEARKRVAQYLTVFNKYEEDVALAMIEENINLPCSFSFQNYLSRDVVKQNGDDEEKSNVASGTIYDWNSIVKALGGIQGRIWMGMGMMKTAHAFLNYIEGISKHIQYLQKKLAHGEFDNHEREEKDDEIWIKSLIKRLDKFIVSTFERAISECPTVEILWMKYLEHLFHVLHDKKMVHGGGHEENDDDDGNEEKLGPDNVSHTKRAKLLVQLQNLASRAVKNCPYSTQLFVFNMQIVLETVRAGNHVLEPDDLMKIVTQAVNGGFLPSPEAHLEVYLSACQVLQRWILELVSRGTSSFNYDDAERLDTAGTDIGGGIKKKRQRGQDVKVKKYLAPLEDELDQVVDDLVEDLREMYDAVEGFLQKKYSKWTQGRYLLYRERAKSEAYVLSPIQNEVNSSDEAIKWFEKMVRIHQPSHPNAWREYISYVIGKAYVELSDNEENQNLDEKDNVVMEIPGMVVAKFRFVRNLYQRSFSSIKKIDAEDASADKLEYMNAMKLLCEEFLLFEKSFGSLKSLDAASKLVAKKLSSMPQKISKDAETTITVEGGGEIVDTRHEGTDLKRKRQDEIENVDDEIQSNDVATAKKQKIMSDDKHDQQVQDAEQIHKEPIVTGITQQDGGVEKHKQANSLEETDSATETKEPEKEEKKRGPNIWPIKPKPEHTVKVGNMEYPAHPYTVHVSNLASETMDMDLYDLFRPCGPIVHARIFREKTLGRGHPHDAIPKSKGAGLIQFEERESVEKALELSGEVGIHEKLIVVTRSNQPAVAIVPPGMHRLNPKGQGKNTTRNLKRKERRLRAAGTTSKGQEPSPSDTNQQQLIGKSDQQIEAQVDAKDTRGSTTNKTDETQPSSTTTTSSILAFRPRNVRKPTPSATARKKKVGI